MNKIYRTVYNQSTQTWTAVAEIASAHGKSASSRSGVVGGAAGTRFAYTLAASAVLLMSGQVMAVTTGADSIGTDDKTCFFDNTTKSVICGDGTTSITNTINTNSPKSVVLGLGATSNGESNVAVGRASHAAGTAAIALGSDAQAKANSSVAIGNTAQSNAAWDISIGREAGLNTTPKTTGEGRNIAIGDGALRTAVTPQNNIAMGTGAGESMESEASVVIGTYANGLTANQEILKAKGGVSANNVVAIGDRALATKSSAVAVGNRTQATGLSATAIGTSTNANADYAVAQGANAQATANYSVAIGGSGNNTSSARATTNPFTTAVGYNSLATGRHGTALGSTTSATGFGSTAVGAGATTAVSSTAGAIGAIAISAATDNSATQRTTASGKTSVAIGVATTASTENSIAIGNSAAANGGAGAIAVGKGTTATGASAVVMGTDSSGTAQSVVVIGNASKATADNAVTIGVKANATGTGNIAIGENAGEAHASNSQGSNTVLIGVKAGAQSTNNQAQIAVGWQAGQGTLGTYNLASGYQAGQLVNGDNNVAFGKGAGSGTSTAQRLTASNTVSIGTSAQASKDNAIAIGNGANAANSYSVAIGDGATTSTSVNADRKGLNVALGSGATIDNSAMSSWEATALGADTYVQGVRTTAVGYGAQATQYYATALGYKSNASEWHSLAMGSQATVAPTATTDVAAAQAITTNLTNVANASHSATAIAIGRSATAAGYAAIAQGVNASASTAYATAFGANSRATRVGSTAFGAYAAAEADSSVALGRYSHADREQLMGTSTVGADPLGAASGSQVGSTVWQANAGAVSVGSSAQRNQAGVNIPATTRQIINVAAGSQDTDAVNVAQLKAAGFELTTSASKGTATGSTVEKVQNGERLTLDAGSGITLAQNANTITISTNAQALAESAQLPVVYTNANGDKLYKHTDGNFYTQPNGAGTQVAAGNVIASMQNAAGSTTTPTKLTNVANGTVSATSKDAVNGSQLFAVGNSTAEALGGSSSFNTTTGKVTAGLKLGNNNYTTVQDALNAINTTASARNTVSAGSNITVATKSNANGSINYEVATAPVMTIGPATAGNPVTINGNAGTITGLTNTTWDPAKIVSGRAATEDQLQQVAARVQTHYYSTNDGGVKQANYNNDGATGGNSLAAGVGTQASGISSTAIGHNANASNSASVAVGWNTQASGNHSMALGGTSGTTNTHAKGDSSMAIGFGAQTGDGASWSVATGDLAKVGDNAERAVAMGALANVADGASNATAVGTAANVAASNATALGAGASATATDGVALGSGSTADRAALTAKAAATDSPRVAANQVYAMSGATEANKDAISATVKGNLGAVSVGDANNTRQIINVAAGTEDTDAVNVAQLKAVAGSISTTTVSAGSNVTVTQQGNNYQVSVAKDVSLDSVTTGDVRMDQSGVRITGGPSMTQSGIDAGGQKISNVAAGTAPTDAVNVSQLQAVGHQLGARINEVDADASAGVAQAIATAGLPQAYLPGKNMVAIGGGVYRGATGYAIGFSTISDNGNWIIKATGSGNSRGNFGASIGAGYQW